VPRYIPAPPAHAAPDERAVEIVEAIRAYATGQGEANQLSLDQISVGMHHILHAANEGFARALANERELPEDRRPTWRVMAKRHAMSPSSLEWRVYRLQGRIPEKWAPGTRKSKET
jgi:hypothetical protein